MSHIWKPRGGTVWLGYAYDDEDGDTLILRIEVTSVHHNSTLRRRQEREAEERRSASEAVAESL